MAKIEYMYLLIGDGTFYEPIYKKKKDAVARKKQILKYTAVKKVKIERLVVYQGI